MPEASFLAAHLAAIILLFWRRDGLDNADIAVGLAVLMPPLLTTAAVLLPRLAGSRSLYQVTKGHKGMAWVAATMFAGAATWLIDGRARSDKLFLTPETMALSLAALVAIYGIYATWFVQSRVIFNERQAKSLREQLTRQEFDVFLCHNGRDKPAVKTLAVRLMQSGIKPWLDEWELRPGLRWQPLLEEQIRAVKSAAVFVGAEGIGPWQSEEIGAFLSACVKRGIPVIPVLLESAPGEPELPLFLAERMWVDFRKAEPDPFERLVFGISGRRTGDS